MIGTSREITPFLTAFRGSFTAALRWPQFDALWSSIRTRADAGWYLYAIGQTPPRQPADSTQVEAFLAALDERLHAERRRDFCGIVYADDLACPSFVKVYDPRNLGTSCGSSAEPPLPGWVMSLLEPCDLTPAPPSAGAYRRWSGRLFRRNP